MVTATSAPSTTPLFGTTPDPAALLQLSQLFQAQQVIQVAIVVIIFFKYQAKKFVGSRPTESPTTDAIRSSTSTSAAAAGEKKG